MRFTIFSTVVILLLVYFFYKSISLLRFYIHARRAGFPVYLSPVLSKSIPWLVLAPAFQPQLEKYLPGWIYERLDLLIHGWEFRRKREFHDRLGSVFAVVTPDECSVFVADPDVGNAILQRRHDFLIAPITARLLGFLGPNVFTVNGDEWKRHRRLFAVNLDERISRTVWIESCQQAQTMLEYMIDHPGGETLDGLRSIAINVIGQSGYSQKRSWSPNPREFTVEATSERNAYFMTLSMVTSMFLEAATLPTKLMRLPLMPPALRSMGKHLERIPQYTKEVLEEERQAATIWSAPRHNFLSLLLQLSDEEKRRGQAEFSLTDEEITGNLFIFSSAGFETTANTMGYAVTLLAAHPEWQDWIREELCGLDADVSTWTYEEVYPKCRRTRAVLLETLRLFPPVVHSTRAVLSPQQLVSADGIHHLAPPMDFFVSHVNIHLDTTIWGPDAEDFKPSRWFNDAGEIITPPKGTFLPWSSGPRVCPGMKMSQVEFVAAMATLFRSARCEPIPTLGLHKTEDLQRRLQHLMSNSVSKLALQMRDAKAVQLRWIRD